MERETTMTTSTRVGRQKRWQYSDGKAIPFFCSCRVPHSTASLDAASLLQFFACIFFFGRIDETNVIHKIHPNNEMGNCVCNCSIGCRLPDRWTFGYGNRLIRAQPITNITIHPFAVKWKIRFGRASSDKSVRSGNAWTGERVELGWNNAITTQSLVTTLCTLLECTI